jgi:hypothetical protein
MNLGGFCEEFREGYACSDTDFMRRVARGESVLVCVPNAYVKHRGDICVQWRDSTDDSYTGERWARNVALMRERNGAEFGKFVTHTVPVRTGDGNSIMPITIAATQMNAKESM